MKITTIKFNTLQRSLGLYLDRIFGYAGNDYLDGGAQGDFRFSTRNHIRTESHRPWFEDDMTPTLQTECYHPNIPTLHRGIISPSPQAA